MDLLSQIEEEKRKSHILGDFVIDTTYIKEMASQVLTADEKTQQTSDFKNTCRLLRKLCEELSLSVMELQDLIPDPDSPDSATDPDSPPSVA